MRVERWTAAMCSRYKYCDVQINSNVSQTDLGIDQQVIISCVFVGRLINVLRPFNKTEITLWVSKSDWTKTSPTMVKMRERSSNKLWQQQEKHLYPL